MRCPLVSLAPTLSMARPLRSLRQVLEGIARNQGSSTTRCPDLSLTLQHQAVSARFTRSHIIYGSSAPLPSPSAGGA